MEDLLNTSDYALHRGDPFPALEKSLNSITSELAKKELITAEQKRTLSQPPSNLPRMYGLPKIHKVGVPLRPVVSTIGSPSYYLSSYCADILNPIRDEYDYSVKNSTEFLERIKSVNITTNYHMFSLDVRALYTSISYTSAVNVLREKWEQIARHTSLSSTLFFKMIRFCIDTAAFVQYKDDIYKQTKGLAMGSPLSAVIADIVLDHVIHSVLDTNCFDIIVLTKYVDDIFIVADKDDVEQIFEAFNAAHTDFVFTIEHEENHSIPYLDVRLIRQENGILSKWYRKPTNKGRLIDFWSAHPHHVKENCIISFARKVLQLSDACFINESRDIIWKSLRANHYPDKLISKSIRLGMSRGPTTTSEQLDAETSQMTYRAVTFCPPASAHIKRQIENNTTNVKVIQKPPPKIGRLLFSNMKSKVDALRKRFVVYQINCLNCNSCYIGHTGKRLEQRVNEHKNDCRLRRSNGTGTALSTHSIEYHHSFDFENPIILDIERNKTKRELSELLHIRNKPNVINYRVDSLRINSAYNT